MFDPSFDPYDSLLKLQQQLKQCSDNIMQLAAALNSRGDQQKKIIDQINLQTEAINEHDLQLQELHARVRLLEVVRQYENKNNPTN